MSEEISKGERYLRGNIRKFLREYGATFPSFHGREDLIEALGRLLNGMQSTILESHKMYNADIHRKELAYITP